MDQKQLATRLRQLDDACDRIGSNLLELDRHPVVVLLEVSDLVGQTAERWSTARAISSGSRAPAIATTTLAGTK